MTQTDVWSPRTFCPNGRFVLTDVLSAGRFVRRTFCPHGRFVPGRFVSGRFVSGHFVWAPPNSLPWVDFIAEMKWPLGI
jgi:hypothetical protein